jgi:HTH-type transcriptional regulator / antitoxin HigA
MVTFSFNSETYSQLLVHYQPRIIKTEEENEKFLQTVEELLSRSHLIPEEDFEDKHYELNISTLQ